MQSDTTGLQPIQVEEGLPTVEFHGGKVYMHQQGSDWRVTHSDTKWTTPSRTYIVTMLVDGILVASLRVYACVCLWHSRHSMCNTCILEIVSGWI